MHPRVGLDVADIKTGWDATKSLTRSRTERSTNPLRDDVAYRMKAGSNRSHAKTTTKLPDKKKQCDD